MAISKHFSYFKLHAIILRASSYCHVHNINHYITNVGGYKWEITKLDNNPEICTFEDIVLQHSLKHKESESISLMIK